MQNTEPSISSESHAEEAALSLSCSTSSSSYFPLCPSLAFGYLPSFCSASCPYDFPVSSFCACLSHQLLRPTWSSSYLMPRPSPSSYQFHSFPPPCLGHFYPCLFCLLFLLLAFLLFLSLPFGTPSDLLASSPTPLHYPCPSSSFCFFPCLHGPWAQIGPPAPAPCSLLQPGLMIPTLHHGGLMSLPVGHLAHLRTPGNTVPSILVTWWTWGPLDDDQQMYDLASYLPQIRASFPRWGSLLPSMSWLSCCLSSAYASILIPYIKYKWRFYGFYMRDSIGSEA